MSENRVIVITGGGGAIGEATAKRFLDADWTVVLIGRTPEKLDAARERLAADDRVLTAACDVAAPDAITACLQELADATGGLDSLVCANGIPPIFQPVEDLVPADLDATLRAVLLGTIYAVRAAAPHLRSPGGSVVTIGAIDGFTVWPGQTGESIAKAGVHAFTRVAAGDLAPRGIRVNAVVPGWVKTSMSIPDLEALGVLDGRMDFPVLGRAGEPHEIAAAIYFLASDDASFITGACLPVDGGHSPYLPMSRRAEESAALGMTNL